MYTRDTTIDSNFLSAISTMTREEKIRELYRRLTQTEEGSISDVDTAVLEELIRNNPEFSPFLSQVLAIDETFTI
jgi:hypothetical protein